VFDIYLVGIRAKVFIFEHFFYFSEIADRCAIEQTTIINFSSKIIIYRWLAQIMLLQRSSVDGAFWICPDEASAGSGLGICDLFSRDREINSHRSFSTCVYYFSYLIIRLANIIIFKTQTPRVQK